jgi:hypothetical protein
MDHPQRIEESSQSVMDGWGVAVLLDNRKERVWEIPLGGRGAFAAEGHYVGKGRAPLEVAVARATRRPNDGDVRNLWKRRKGNTASPLVLVVLWPGPTGELASVCGPGGDQPAVYADRDPAQIARIAALALDEPDHHAARRLVDAYLPEQGGVRNHSLFATHHLLDRVPARSDWAQRCAESVPWLGLRREELIEALGFSLEPSGQAVLLRAQGNARAMALFLGHTESPDAVSTRFNGMTPVSWAVARATSDNIPYVIVERDDQLRIYASLKDPTSRSGAFVELNLPLLTATDAGYLSLLFSAASLSDGGDLAHLLAESLDFALGLGDRLRNRVYDEAVPAIAEALIARHEADSGATDLASLTALYNRTLLVLFRLLFVAYAEDRGLLPLQSNDLYRQRSLKHLARELADLVNEHGLDEVPYDEYSTDYWDNVRALWAAVDKGRKEWNVPAYNGGLFSSESDLNLDGAALTDLSMTNAEFGPCLLGLLIDEGENGFGPIDFASLDVREFGTIYEGLLESDLAVAVTDLTVNKEEVYVPAKEHDAVIVAEGGVYLHNQSGARKSSGSYFTKPFAVQHLLEHALEPALDGHIDRLRALMDAGEEIEAGRVFFDFRCIDLSMGSGHFLVAAVDHIEGRLSGFLAEHRVSAVIAELDRLGQKSADNLAEVGLVADEADTSSLLRRQIARRCIYGVDLNPTSVELARLALWIHTFVSGLPLTSLNHGLVAGNSLTGIGTLDEVVAILDPGSPGGSLSFVSSALDEALGSARDSLARFAEIGEADKAEVKLAREAQREAEEATNSARLLCDLAVAVRLGEATIPPYAFTADAFLEAAESEGASATARELGALHLPTAFPEVFLRDRPGFDCILGNPPWDEATVEELGFFALRFPGLKSMRQAEQKSEIAKIRHQRPDLVADYGVQLVAASRKRQVLLCGPFPGMGIGDPDLYKAFAWRFWQVLRPGGAVGVVLPRSALAAAGLAQWRETILGGGTFSDVTMLLNSAGWVFDDAEYRYTIGLVTLRKGGGFAGSLAINGPFSSLTRYRERGPAIDVATDEFLSWSEAASFPLLPSPKSIQVFRTMHAHPRFDANDELRVRPMREFDATNDKKHMVLGPADSDDLWPVYGGRGFNLWESETGEYFAWADPKLVLPLLQEKRVRAARLARSAFNEFPAEWVQDETSLPCLHPRIAFRDIARATDTRTIMLPPEIILTNPAPYLLMSGSDARAEAFVLAVMCSIPFDWIARREVEMHVNFHVLNSLPLPRPDRDDPLRQRAVEIAGTLAAVDSRYEEWAVAVGVPIGAVSKSEREPLLAELDAAVALLYGLNEEDVEVVFSTFHEGWQYGPRLAAVLEHHRRLQDLST